MDERQRFIAAVAALALLGLLILLRGLRRQALRAARAELEAGRVSVARRGVLLGGLIVAGQWLTITHAAHNPTLFWTVLGVPAAVAGLALARVSAPEASGRRRGGGHR